MNLNWKRIGAYAGILAGIQVIIITSILMVIYPGGYNFFLNTFSDLGYSVINMVPTPHRHLLFSITLTLAAGLSVLFWLAVRTLFTETTILKILGVLGTILGFVAAPFLSALAIFANDVFPTQHGLSTILFFFLFSSAILVYSIAILLNKDYENLYALIGVIVVIISYVYVIGMVANIPVLGDAAMQKLTIYALILYSAFQVYKLLKVFD